MVVTFCGERMYFDRKKLTLKPLSERQHGLDTSWILPLDESPEEFDSIKEIASRMVKAKSAGSEIIMMIGGHVVRSGAQKYILDLMERGFITCLAMNGSCIIHDFELALVGATTESVPYYLDTGQFGLWSETGRINDIVNSAHADGLPGLGYAVGKAISEGSFPRKDISLLAACYRLDIPSTVHVGIGYDIIHEHPNFDGASAGALSYNDFLRFTDSVSRLENGVFMNFGSAVAGPEVFLKALSMARNAALQDGREIRCFTSAVFDIHDLPDSYRQEPQENMPGYYFRPWKTILVRSVTGGGESFYVRGRHRETIPALWTAINRLGI